MTRGKLLKKMAEGTGLEPASPCGRRFSRPLHYQLCYPSESLALDDSLHVRARSTGEFLGGQLKVRVRRSVTEPRAVATGPLIIEELRTRQETGRYRSRFCNDRVALPPADSHL